MKSMNMQKSKKILLEHALAMIFIDFLVCYVAHTAKYLTYLLRLR